MANIGSKRLLFVLQSLQSNRLLLRAKTRSNQLCRESHGYAGYREWNYEPNRPYIQRLAHFNAALMWCYIYWRFRHDYGEIIGEYFWPNRDQWSDEHLGIPGDEEE